MAVSTAFRKLLSEKHLYQVVEVNFSDVESAILGVYAGNAPATFGQPYHWNSKEDFLEVMRERVAAVTWIPDGATVQPSQSMSDSGPSYVDFDLPTINTFCSACDTNPPCNPMFDVLICRLDAMEEEWFCVGYKCQQCKGPPIRFLVRREGTKLRLVGRDPLEVLPTPKVLPKAASKFYSDAQIAHHAGQTLAGLFLLRVFIEQFWRTHPSVGELLKRQPKATGDEQGTLYQDTLPEDFKSRFPSLRKVYDRLSAAMHSANADSALFDESCAAILEHFEARRLYKLDSNQVAKGA